MAQLGNQFPARSLSTRDWTAAQADGAGVLVNLPLPAAIAADGLARARVRGLNIISVENVGWEVFLWGTRTSPADAIDSRKFIGSWRFDAADGKTYTGLAAPLYHYHIDGLDLAYLDEDTMAQKLANTPPGATLHVTLVPRGAGKSADAAGAVVVEFVLEPTLGW